MDHHHSDLTTSWSSMKKDDSESLDEWAERVRIYELGYALQQVAKGQDVNVVMEAMAARMCNKVLHPVMTRLKS